MDADRVPGHGGNQKSDYHAAGHHGGPTDHRLQMDQEKAHHGGQACAEKGHVDILREGLASVAGIEPAPQDNGSNIYQVLPQQGKPRHHEKAGKRHPSKGELHGADDEGTDQQHQRRIEKSCTHAAGGHRVCDQPRLAELNMP